jgi:serine/threonine-protein kinase
VSKTLEAAHAQGIVHRDVKPSNILVLADNSTALLDLGMGPKHDPEGKSILIRDERLDSVAYFSPEITRQSAVDGRADVYSLAAVLFALLCGHRPFSAKSHIELIRKIRWEGAPNLAELKPDLPATLCAEIARAMEKDAAARHATASEFATAVAASVKS